MAWKRGTQNNSAGEIRKGHIKEFLQKSSKASGVVGKLHIVSLSSLPSLKDSFEESYFALVCSPENGLPHQFVDYVDNNMLLLHAHEHPRVVLSALIHPDVPPCSIVLNEVQCLNSKVCTGEYEDWTVYAGDHITYDGREGAIGATEVKVLGNKSISRLTTMCVAIRPRFPHTSDSDETMSPILCDATKVSRIIQKAMYDCVISCDEVFQVTVPSDSSCDLQLVCRVVEVEEEIDDDDKEVDEEVDIEMPDCYRGRVTAETSVYLNIEGSTEFFNLANNTVKPSSPPLTNVVTILTSDDEEFPVKRRLLRPCIALTSVVQAGRGKYQSSIESGDGREGACDPISINVDACTFDRVLLYLEHAAREEEFKFDPLIAPELLTAAETLNILGLQESCQKVLGSFKERVRQTAIPLEEVFKRNARGYELSLPPPRGVGKRGETLLIMSGMVFDITRWLDEHPGGSTIIPEQSLNMDCTSFFEIYHASRQSFLYLKEFYIGELAESDLSRVPLPAGEVPPSAAFMEQLKRVTPWRLNREELKESIFVHKSF